MAATPSANEPWSNTKPQSQWTNDRTDAAPPARSRAPTKREKCFPDAAWKDIDIKAYGGLREVLNYAHATDDTCILIQEAGRTAYDDDQLATFKIKAEKNIAAFAKYANPVHIFNFDGGDKHDAEAPDVTEVCRSDDLEDLGEVETVNGVLLNQGETPEVAIRDAFRDQGCYSVSVGAPLKSCYSARLETVSDIEGRAAKTANVAYTWIPVWDYYMPTQNDVNKFVYEYSQQPPGTTNVFHCGAGIGRSGLFVLAARVTDIKKRGGSPPQTWEELDTLLRNTYARSTSEIRDCGSRKLKALFEMLESVPTSPK